MFYVFGIDDAIAEKRIRKIHPEFGIDRVKEAVKNSRPYQIHEYDTLSTAREYVEVLRKSGFREVSIKCRILGAIISSGKPSHKWIDANDLDKVDESDQSRLRAILNGGRFAPRLGH